MSDIDRTFLKPNYSVTKMLPELKWCMTLPYITFSHILGNPAKRGIGL
jgi:hypothetical protein